MFRIALVTVVLATGCARGLVDEQEGSITTDVPPTFAEEQPPARRVSADAPLPAPGTARASYDDPAGDVAAPGADVRRVTVAQDKDFMLEVAVQVVGQGNVELFIDSDLNPKTGVDGFDVRVTGSAATNAVELWFQEGGAWTAEDVPTFTGSYANGTLVMRIHRQYLGPEGSRGPIGIAAGTQEDRAPDGAPADRYTFKPL